MSDIKTAIMDAAERRIQRGGFGGFSFRDIAADVGIKSSSVHYHFPTKDDLAASVVRRWSDSAARTIDLALEHDPDPSRVFRDIFGGTAHSPERMCPCTVLGAALQDLPAQAAAAVKSFFQMCEHKMMSHGLAKSEASKVLATLLGAIILATAFGDASEYDRATSDLAGQRHPSLG
jgi:TetR/AcrR family transcriptional repressor of nem operon